MSLLQNGKMYYHYPQLGVLLRYSIWDDKGGKISTVSTVTLVNVLIIYSFRSKMERIKLWLLLDKNNIGSTSGYEYRCVVV